MVVEGKEKGGLGQTILLKSSHVLVSETEKSKDLQKADQDARLADRSVSL